MWFARVAIFVLLVSCAQQSKKAEQAALDASAKNDGIASPGSAHSADALAAKQLVKSYFDLIGDKKYEAAYNLWGNNGADTKGTAADFAKSFDSYSSYLPEVGDPTDVKTSDGQNYVAVDAKIRVTMEQTGKSFIRSGPVMLRRSAGKGGEWRIWGIDVRVRN